MVDYWSHPGGETLSALEGAILDQETILLVYGTEEGNVWLRVNWKLQEKHFEIGNEESVIKKLKFSFDL